MEISVVVLLGAVAVVEVVALLLALCAKTGPIRRAAELRTVLKCILGGRMVVVSRYGLFRRMAVCNGNFQSSPCDVRDWKWQRLQFRDQRKTGEEAAREWTVEGSAVNMQTKSV